MISYYKLAVNTPFNNSVLTYKGEAGFSRGDLVEVPLGKRNEKACVVELMSEDKLDENFDLEKIKSIKGPLEYFNSLDESFLNFLEWVTSYYHYPLGQHIFDILPKALKRPRDVKILKGEDNKFEYDLTDEQLEAIERIEAKFNSFNKYLLHGVTGSGKTSVYIKLIKKALMNKKNVLFLIPEINLTPQFLSELKKYCPHNIFSYHSSISNSERLKMWELVQSSEENYVLVGVRSSIFLPYKNLGLIVVDEEHDNSFKQEDRLTYHARDVAIKLASDQNIPIILGSATPTVETYYQSQKDESKYIRMAKRPNDLEMPNISIVDARERTNHERSDEIWPFTIKTLEKIKKRVENKEQVLVFVNRLGFASYVQCHSCGKDFNCPNCSTNLKYFKRTHTLNCQFCEYKEAYPDQCPECGNLKLLQQGFGTERLQEVLEGHLSDAKIGRFDRDIIKTFDQLKQTLNDFAERKYDILVGTQMLSKGHNFENVNLVAIMGVDSQLNFPDFRSNEKVFQLITQVSGRPGRKKMQGEVLIESLSPENNIFDKIKNYEWFDFYKQELEIREALSFPPFARMICLYITSRFENEVKKASGQLSVLVNDLVEKSFNNVEVHGPRPAIIEKRANKFSWVLLLKADKVNELHNLVKTLRLNVKFHHSVTIKYDIDPQVIG